LFFLFAQSLHLQESGKQANMHIRLAITDDLEAINSIYNQAIDERLTADMAPISIAARETWLSEHDNSTHPVFVYEINNEVVAWLSFSKYRPGRGAFKNTAEISYYVHNHYRRSGIGTTLVQFARQQAIQYGFKNLVAMVLEWNTGSIHLLEKNGFEQWGFLPRIADFEGTVCGHLYFGINL
jgi:L-amino acid N-acyltransferase YncA